MAGGLIRDPLGRETPLRGLGLRQEKPEAGEGPPGCSPPHEWRPHLKVALSCLGFPRKPVEPRFGVHWQNAFYLSRILGAHLGRGCSLLSAHLSVCWCRDASGGGGLGLSCAGSPGAFAVLTPAARRGDLRRPGARRALGGGPERRRQPRGSEFPACGGASWRGLQQDGFLLSVVTFGVCVSLSWKKGFLSLESVSTVTGGAVVRILQPVAEGRWLHAGHRRVCAHVPFLHGS